jgi:hypothetical protein
MFVAPSAACVWLLKGEHAGAPTYAGDMTSGTFV